MNQFDADILRKLNGQQYWDIEELWEGWQLDIATMERFDSEEWIEIRLNGIGPNGRSTAQTPTIVQGNWFSPHKHCEPWQKYFIVDSDDVRPRWRERCLQQIGFLMYENTSHTDFYTSEKRFPCELKLATKGRIALAQSAVTTQPAQGRMPELQKHDTLAWKLSLLDGYTQTKIAEQLTAQFGEIYSQGQVSRMISRAKQHANRSGLSEHLEKPKSLNIILTDPSKIDMGSRTDKRKPTKKPNQD